MIVREDVALAPYTSLWVGGPARFFVEVVDTQELREAALFARKQNLPLRVLGAGTNIVVPDAGIEAVVVTLTNTAFALETSSRGSPILIADSGAPWNALVDMATESALWGIENLAGIPGSAGGALVQNIGAYGAELADVFAEAEVYDLTTDVERRMGREEVALGYRTSLFKRRPELIITRIVLELSREAVPMLTYPDLVRARETGVPLATPRDIAVAVRTIRAGKFPQGGRSAGSFFKNPLVEKAIAIALQDRYPGLPAYPSGRAMKLSLAWLLDHVLGLAGYSRGPVRLFEKQPLVIVASAGARAADIEALADEVEERVHDTFGITLEREVELFC